MTEILFEAKTADQADINISHLKRVTVISTGGSGDTLIQVGVSTARYATIGTITGGVGSLTVDVAAPMLKVVRGTGATLDATGSTI